MEYYTKIVRDPKDIAEIDRLTRIIWDLQAEIERLRKKLLWPVRQNPDDVLVRRIEILKDEMAKQQQDYEQKISELTHDLFTLRIRQWQDSRNRPPSNSAHIADEHVDLLATILCLYPFTSTDDIEFEFGIKDRYIRFVNQVLGQVKSSEARKAARDYLRRQGLELIDRRGGDQGKHYGKPVLKITRNGRVVEDLESLTDASRATGMAFKTIRNYCDAKKRIYTSEGYTFRYKEL